MKIDSACIVDLGRGPQLEGSYDYEFIHRAIPSLTRPQFDAIAAYVEEHREELIEKDRRVEERNRKGIEVQRAKGGIFAEPPEDLTTEERVARLTEKMKRKLAEKNGADHPD